MDDLVSRPIRRAPAGGRGAAGAPAEHGVSPEEKARSSVGEHADGGGHKADLTSLDGGGAPAAASAGGMEGLGARLKELRQRAGLSLRELARQADVSPSLVSQIENGKSRPSVSTLYTFARLLNVPVDGLFDAEEHALPAPPAAGADDAAYDPANAWHP